MPGNCQIPLERWLLEENPTFNKLSYTNHFRDLYMWNRYEIGFTLVAKAIHQLTGANSAACNNLPLSLEAQQGLKDYLQLYPEWLRGKSYTSIAIPEREKRLAEVFTNDYLALEPAEVDIPPNLYNLLRAKKATGKPLVLPGSNADLYTFVLPHQIPLNEKLALIRHTILQYETTSPDRKTPIVSGHGSRSSQLKTELKYCGRYRLLEAHNFDVPKALRAIREHSHDVYYDAWRFMKSLLQKRWELAETHFRVFAGSRIR